MNSFRVCNLDPQTQLSFDSWCEKICPYLLAGQTFKVSKQLSTYDMYKMMPSFW